MTPFKRALSFGAAGLAILAATPAQAYVTAEARLTEMRIRVIDLDLNDGVTAALTLGHQATDGTFATASISADADSAADHMTAGAGGPAYALVGTSFALASAYMVPGDLFSRRNSPTADALVSVSGKAAGASAYAEALTSFFELTQNTRLVITAFGEVSTLSTEFGERANASAQLGISGFNGEAGAFDVIDSYVTGDGAPGSSASKQLRASFASGAQSTSGVMFVLGSAGVYGVDPVSLPVPEPATNALLLGGLGLVWAALRRRARAST